MQITVTPTMEQIAASLADTWGCSPDAVDTSQLTGIVELKTNVKGINKAERVIAKVTAGAKP